MKKSQKIAKMNAKKAARKERHDRKEHLTNRYMLDFTYGILGIIIILIIRSLYSGSALVYMDTAMWILFGVLVVVAAAMIIVGKLKEHPRLKNYGILIGVCALFALWFALFNKTRMVLEAAVRAISGNAQLSVSSYWNFRIPIIAIAAYLVIGFVVYMIRVSRK